ncbi:MAG: TolB-like 6-bladed beta-propeller domain-containing protein [Rikenellaceae bacterium]|jgi:hypothetical protein|nr:TolB-like 6-bladed beta-propeller domain-containing protein [Rikenellaceae bacterium]
MRFKLFLSITLTLCCLSCSRKTDKLIVAEIVSFDRFHTEVDKTAHATTLSAMGVFSIAIDSNILVAVTSNPASIIALIDLDHENTVLEFCSRGRGPGEYLYFGTQKQFEERNGHSCLWTYDRDKEYSQLIDITGSVKEQKLVVAESWEMSNDYGVSNNYSQNSGIVILPESERFVKFPVTYQDARDNLFFSPKYVYFSPNNEAIKELEFYNEEEFSLSSFDFVNAKVLIAEGAIRIKPDRTKAIDAFYHADHLNFLDLTKNNGFSMSYSKGLTVDELASMPFQEMQKKYVRVYVDAAVTDSHVFALYSGKPEAEDPTTVPDVHSAIRIFDWDGNPLALVNLDRELISIAYDQRTKRLYGLNPEENIVYYELNDVI